MRKIYKGFAYLLFNFFWLSLASCALFDPDLSADLRQRDNSVVENVEFKRGVNHEKNTIKLISLNLAHGRKTQFHQVLLNRNQLKQNLSEVAKFLDAEQADIVGLQEADGPSRWSGGFDHVAYLAHQGRYQWHARSNHVNNVLGHYGTAVMSRYKMLSSLAYDFSPSPPTPRKGFTQSRIVVPFGRDVEKSSVVQLISVHLDFSRDSIRDKQIEEIKQFLVLHPSPTIIVGDFNSDWISGGSGNESGIAKILKGDRFHTHKRNSDVLATYGDKRLDWVLLSEELEFKRYRVAKEVLSDHRAIVAEIGLKAR